jgi:SAM-dependent methyltransferase
MTAMATLPSYIRNAGQISFTYQDSGVYGRYLNESRLAAWALALDRHSIPVREILDIGCSYGSWADNWRRLGFKKLLGAEPNAEAAAKARGEFDEVAVCYSFDVGKHFPKVDVIAANAVIIHILEKTEEERFLRDLAGCLTVGGFLLFSVVNARYYASPAGRKPWTGPNSCTRYLEDHEKMARRAGLRILDAIGTFINPWFVEDLDFISGNSELLNDWNLYDGLLRFAAPLRRSSLVPFGEVLFIAQRAT